MSAFLPTGGHFRLPDQRPNFTSICLLSDSFTPQNIKLHRRLTFNSRMYRKETSITMKGSASSLCNNLSVYVLPDKRQLNYAVVNKSMVNIACASTDGTSVTGRQVSVKEPSVTQCLPFVMQAKWVILPSRPVLVLTTQRGIQVFEPDGSAMIYWHSLSDSMDKSNCAKGIAGVGDSILCIGTETGSILALNIPQRGTNVTITDTLNKHTAPVSDLASDKDILSSADEFGTIIVWKLAGTKLSPVTSIKGTGWPCNSLALWGSVLVAGFASGHLRVYNALTGTLGAEVLAHGRAINAVSVSKENGMLLSVSDDTFFMTWQLKALKIPQQPNISLNEVDPEYDGWIAYQKCAEIEFRHGQCVADVQLVGGSFVDGHGKALALTGYDTNEIMFYVQR